MQHTTHVEAKILAGSGGLREVAVADFGNRQAGIDFLERLLPALRALNEAATSGKAGSDGH